VLDLGNEGDVVGCVLRAHGSGYETAVSDVSSAAEGKEREDVVSIEEGYVRRNNQKRQKRAVRVDEIGPRMEIRRVKVTEGALGIECALIYQ